VSLRVQDPVPALRALTGWAADRGGGLPGLEVRRPSLEDIYLELTEGARSGGGSSASLPVSPRGDAE
ncbi:MAG: DUF4162 domain-containing protein, partial [Actinomycetota bacterium]|nr:DUF4162 domain-containing protein [Actinomycetota bacterium]